VVLWPCLVSALPGGSKPCAAESPSFARRHWIVGIAQMACQPFARRLEVERLERFGNQAPGSLMHFPIEPPSNRPKAPS
jgi:hypothetical protein